jgi:uncharacterized protein DUF3592
MFEELYDRMSLLFSWGWPTATGEITAVDVERVGDQQHHRFRLAVAYKFWVAGDGPYTGESFWDPKICSYKRVLAARHKVRVRRRVLVRYRPDDPSVNTVDRDVWRRR